MATQQEIQPVKLTLTHYRKPEHTHKAFMDWIAEKHIPLAMPVFQRHGILGYSIVRVTFWKLSATFHLHVQFATPPALNEVLRKDMKQLRPMWDVADFDCIIEYTLPNMETMINMMGDPEWLESVKDQVDWVITTKSLVSLGYHTPYLLETGEVVNLKRL